MDLNLNDIVVTKKEAESLNEKLHFDPDLADRLSKMSTETLANALWVEIHGRNRKEMVHRIQRRLFRNYIFRAERHIEKYRDRYGTAA